MPISKGLAGKRGRGGQKENLDTNSQRYLNFDSQVQPDTHNLSHLQPDKIAVPLVTHHSLAGEAESVRCAKSNPGLVCEVFNFKNHNRTAT